MSWYTIYGPEGDTGASYSDPILQLRLADGSIESSSVRRETCSAAIAVHSLSPNMPTRVSLVAFQQLNQPHRRGFGSGQMATPVVEKVAKASPASISEH